MFEVTAGGVPITEEVPKGAMLIVPRLADGAGDASCDTIDVALAATSTGFALHKVEASVGRADGSTIGVRGAARPANGLIRLATGEAATGGLNWKKLSN